MVFPENHLHWADNKLLTLQGWIRLWMRTSKFFLILVFFTLLILRCKIWWKLLPLGWTSCTRHSHKKYWISSQLRHWGCPQNLQIHTAWRKLLQWSPKTNKAFLLTPSNWVALLLIIFPLHSSHLIIYTSIPLIQALKWPKPIPIR